MFSIAFFASMGLTVFSWVRYINAFLDKNNNWSKIGGDEFAAFLMNEDYTNRTKLAEEFNSRIESNLGSGGPVVAFGISVFDPDSDTGYDAIFERADELMYKRKKELKQLKQK